MNEKLLQFIWQFQHFEQKGLQTNTGELLQIISPGTLNSNQGPDFLDARIRIGDSVWVGNVELHLRSSYWSRHGHHEDTNFDNVILHVVWTIDQNPEGLHKTALPVLEISQYVSKLLLQRYEGLMGQEIFIPCERSILNIPELNWVSWKERLLLERLIRKSQKIGQLLKQNNFHWEETCWKLIARNFGIKVNADAFEAMAGSIPYPVLSRQRKHLIQLEALLFGQSGLLKGRFREAYPSMLQKEYWYQRSKHQLRPILMPIYFLRMRPVNFPTVRLAQLAMLLHGTENLFSSIREEEDIHKIKAMFDVVANDYWHYHYRFDEETTFKQKRSGAEMIENILINTVCPLLFTYGNYHGDDMYKIRALNWLEFLQPETNRISRGFKKIGLAQYSAYDSQALIELKTQYCDARRCLECAVGYSLLKG